MILLDFIVSKYIDSNGIEAPYLTLFFAAQLEEAWENGLIRRTDKEWMKLLSKFTSEQNKRIGKLSSHATNGGNNT